MVTLYKYIVIIMLSFGATYWIYQQFFIPDAGNQNATLLQSSSKALPGQNVIGGHFTLTDHKGNTTSSKDLPAPLQMIYFGFTSCPNICPVDMANLTKVMEQLGDSASQVQPIMITVDPERDTPEQMANYLSNFHSSFIGFTGTKEAVTSVIKQYKVYAKKQEDESMQGGYLMDHSGFTYVVNKQGEYLTHFRHNQPVDEIVSRLRELVQNQS